MERLLVLLLVQLDLDFIQVIGGVERAGRLVRFPVLDGITGCCIVRFDKRAVLLDYAEGETNDEQIYSGSKECRRTGSRAQE
jgi:hypothetical protein